uniref:C2H2-type domain-containing protein n=1 Tax=Anopheles albimanus TaxID=7167 RepID=A0A182FJT6_ANOAL
MDTLIECPVCTLYLRSGMNLSVHLDTHPKESVIKALVAIAQKRTTPSSVTHSTGGETNVSGGGAILGSTDIFSYLVLGGSGATTTTATTEGGINNLLAESGSKVGRIVPAVGQQQTDALSLNITGRAQNHTPPNAIMYDGSTTVAYTDAPVSATGLSTALLSASSTQPLVSTVGPSAASGIGTLAPNHTIALMNTCEVSGVTTLSHYPANNVTILKREYLQQQSNPLGGANTLGATFLPTAESLEHGSTSSSNNCVAGPASTVVGRAPGGNNAISIYPRYTNELYSGPPPPYSTAISSSVATNTQIMPPAVVADPATPGPGLGGKLTIISRSKTGAYTIDLKNNNIGSLSNNDGSSTTTHQLATYNTLVPFSAIDAPTTTSTVCSVANVSMSAGSTSAAFRSLSLAHQQLRPEAQYTEREDGSFVVFENPKKIVEYRENEAGELTLFEKIVKSPPWTAQVDQPKPMLGGVGQQRHPGQSNDYSPSQQYPQPVIEDSQRSGEVVRSEVSGIASSSTVPSYAVQSMPTFQLLVASSSASNVCPTPALAPPSSLTGTGTAALNNATTSDVITAVTGSASSSITPPTSSSCVANPTEPSPMRKRTASGLKVLSNVKVTTDLSQGIKDIILNLNSRNGSGRTNAIIAASSSLSGSTGIVRGHCSRRSVGEERPVVSCGNELIIPPAKSPANTSNNNSILTSNINIATVQGIGTNSSNEQQQDLHMIDEVEEVLAEDDLLEPEELDDDDDDDLEENEDADDEEDDEEDTGISTEVDVEGSLVKPTLNNCFTSQAINTRMSAKSVSSNSASLILTPLTPGTSERAPLRANPIPNSITVVIQKTEHHRLSGVDLPSHSNAAGNESGTFRVIQCEDSTATLATDHPPPVCPSGSQTQHQLLHIKQERPLVETEPKSRSPQATPSSPIRATSLICSEISAHDSSIDIGKQRQLVVHQVALKEETLHPHSKVATTHHLTPSVSSDVNVDVYNLTFIGNAGHTVCESVLQKKEAHEDREAPDCINKERVAEAMESENQDEDEEMPDGGNEVHIVNQDSKASVAELIRAARQQFGCAGGSNDRSWQMKVQSGADGFTVSPVMVGDLQQQEGEDEDEDIHSSSGGEIDEIEMKHIPREKPCFYNIDGNKSSRQNHLDEASKEELVGLIGPTNTIPKKEGTWELHLRHQRILKKVGNSEIDCTNSNGITAACSMKSVENGLISSTQSLDKKEQIASRIPLSPTVEDNDTSESGSSVVKPMNTAKEKKFFDEPKQHPRELAIKACSSSDIKEKDLLEAGPSKTVLGSSYDTTSPKKEPGVPPLQSYSQKPKMHLESDRNRQASYPVSTGILRSAEKDLLEAGPSHSTGNLQQDRRSTVVPRVMPVNDYNAASSNDCMLLTTELAKTVKHNETGSTGHPVSWVRKYAVGQQCKTEEKEDGLVQTMTNDTDDASRDHELLMTAGTAVSTESLNIRTDEKMPAKGEISEQESNGDMDMTSWNRLYTADDNIPIYPSSYDLSTAQESWNLSNRLQHQSHNQLPGASTSGTVSNSAHHYYVPHGVGFRFYVQKNQQSPQLEQPLYRANGSDGELVVAEEEGVEEEEVEEEAVQDSNEHGAVKDSIVVKVEQHLPFSVNAVKEAKLMVQEGNPSGPSYFDISSAGGQQQQSMLESLSLREEATASSKAGGKLRVYRCQECPKSFASIKQRRLHVHNEHAEEHLQSTQQRHQHQQEPQTLVDSKEGIIGSVDIAMTGNSSSGTTVSSSPLQVIMNYYWLKQEIQRKCEATTTGSSSAIMLSARSSSATGENGVAAADGTNAAMGFVMGSGVVPANRKRTYVCGKCKKQFQRFNQFDAHLMEHPVECCSCSRTFKQWRNFSLHVKRHLGIKEHQCRACGKQFVIKQKLVEHMRIHSGIAPIKCQQCGRQFKRFSNLAQHRNRHHVARTVVKKDFVCQQCGEVFHSQAKMAWHQEIHEKQPKSCPYCREKFIHRNSLTRHIRLSHTEKYAKLELKTEPCTWWLSSSPAMAKKASDKPIVRTQKANCMSSTVSTLKLDSIILWTTGQLRSVHSYRVRSIQC